MTVHRRLAILIGLLCVLAPGFCGAQQRDAQTYRIRVRVVDAESRVPLAARLYLESESGNAFYFSSDDPDGTAVKYEKQNWINKASIEYHTTVSAHPCSASVTNGRYRLTVERGKTYFPHSEDIEVAGSDVSVNVQLRRWDMPETRGWYSGDTHLHRSVEELKNIIAAENLNVALPLTNWVTLSDTPPSAGNKNLVDVPKGLVAVDGTHVIWPLNTEYEIFTVGKKRHTLGALFVLGHEKPLELGVPPWRPIVTSASESNESVLFDMDKLDWPFAMVLPTIAPNALYELSNNHVWRTEFAFRDWNTHASNHIQPPFGAASGGHRQWIDYTLGMYYTLLNCGFRLPPSAGTANGVHPVPAGFGRVYVHLPDGFEFKKWMAGLKQGRSFVTTGPMLYATADSQDPGHVFRTDGKDEIPIRIETLSDGKLSYGELLVNGRPEILLRPQNTPLDNGSFRTELNVIAKPTRSGWFAVRFWQPTADGQSRFVHSAPWYVDVGGQPVRPAIHEKRYLIERMQGEIVRSKDVVSEPAMQEYVRALQYYQSLPVQEESLSNARALGKTERKNWLDNMILDHRFTADEVRRATGLSIQHSDAEVESRAGVAPKQGFRIRPYPGGRHPRIGFLDGAIAPQRETKISVFTPWNDGGYVVVDVPEAVFSNLGLTYLAHTHIPTIWDDQSIKIPRREWEATSNGFRSRRELPNGIKIVSEVTPSGESARMKIQLTNGTKEKLTGMRVQVCTMLKGAIGFNVQERLQSVTKENFIAVKSENEDRWIITGWSPNHRVWTNPPVPCFHSDPIFPDCEPGETVTVSGGLWFYEGNNVTEEIENLSEKLLRNE